MYFLLLVLSLAAQYYQPSPHGRLNYWPRSKSFRCLDEPSKAIFSATRLYAECLKRPPRRLVQVRGRTAIPELINAAAYSSRARVPIHLLRQWLLSHLETCASYSLNSCTLKVHDGLAEDGAQRVPRHDADRVDCADKGQAREDQGAVEDLSPRQYRYKPNLAVRKGLRIRRSSVACVIGTYMNRHTHVQCRCHE